MPRLFIEPGRELAKMLGEPLPLDALPSQQYEGEPRLIVPTVRTGVTAGEPLRLTVIAMGSDPREAALFLAALGRWPVVSR